MKFERKVEIRNKLGLHARPAAKLVQKAKQFKSKIIMEKDGQEVDCKSIMGVMMLGVSQGSKVKIITVGEDAEEAMGALVEVITTNLIEE